MEKEFSFKSDCVINRKFYTWDDTEYRDFMLYILLNLEPIRYEKNTLLVNELDEFNEIKFITKGQVIIGYEINK